MKRTRLFSLVTAALAAGLQISSLAGQAGLALDVRAGV